MSLHNDIQQEIRAALETFGDLDVQPDSLATKLIERFDGANADPHIEYGAREHFKQMARALLANKYEPDGGAESEAYQGDMFSGHLQARYPLPHEAGALPRYRSRSLLSQAELDWNIAQLRKSADARLRHADALQAYRDSRAADRAA